VRVAPVVEIGHELHGRAGVDDVERCLGSRLRHPRAIIPRAGRPSGIVPAQPETALAATPSSAAFERSPGARFQRLRAEAERGAGATRLVVGLGSCGVAVGARATLDALGAEIARRGLAVSTVAGGCSGACWAAPAVTVMLDGAPPLLAGSLLAADVPRFLDALAAGGVGRFALDVRWRDAQQRVLLERCGAVIWRHRGRDLGGGYGRSRVS
jgi:NADP-reducing hydrogenase subunit HndB